MAHRLPVHAYLPPPTVPSGGLTPTPPRPTAQGHTAASPFVSEIDGAGYVAAYRDEPLPPAQPRVPLSATLSTAAMSSRSQRPAMVPGRGRVAQFASTGLDERRATAAANRSLGVGLGMGASQRGLGGLGGGGGEGSQSMGASVGTATGGASRAAGLVSKVYSTKLCVCVCVKQPSHPYDTHTIAFCRHT